MSNPSKKTKAGYTKDFKIEAVRLALKSKSVQETAKDLGISDRSLYNWVKTYNQDATQAFPGKGHLSSESEELRKLRQEVKNLREINDILKKATTFFAAQGK